MLFCCACMLWCIFGAVLEAERAGWLAGRSWLEGYTEVSGAASVASRVAFHGVSLSLRVLREEVYCTVQR